MRRHIIFSILVLFAPSALAETIVGGKPQSVVEQYLLNPPDVSVDTWIEGLIAPWSLVFLNPDRALVSERGGDIRLIEKGKLMPTPITTIEVAKGGEGGLMGLALHPRFPTEPYLYTMLTHAHDPVDGNRVIRLRLTADGRKADFDRIILQSLPGARVHDGGRIAFGPDGYLYVATGEIFERDLAQRHDNLGGKILRIDADGRIPPDNPFPNSPIWSLGHRNPQGLAFHPQTKQLFASEHGPSGEVGLGGFDEINLIEKGQNYGWPLAVGAVDRPEFRDPLVAWSEVTTPPSGMAFWHNALFVATLRSQALIRITLRQDGSQYFVTGLERWFVHNRSSGKYGRLRDVVAGPDNALYLLTNNRDGRGSPKPGDDKILRLKMKP